MWYSERVASLIHKKGVCSWYEMLEMSKKSKMVWGKLCVASLQFASRLVADEGVLAMTSPETACRFAMTLL